MSYRTSSPAGFGASTSMEPTASSSSSGDVNSSPFHPNGGTVGNLANIPIPTIRKNTRDLERRLGEAIDSCGTSMESEPFDVVLQQIRTAQTLLDQLVQANQTLANIASQSHVDSSQSGLQYHQDKLRYFTQSFRRMKQAWEEKRQREELFNHAAHNKEADDPNADTSVSMKLMMADSDSLSTSNRNMNSIINQGEEVKQLIIRGRLALAGASNRIQNSIAQFSSIDGAMRIIQRAKVKHTIIIGVVIGLCLCVFLWMLF